jgi:hypothetical protein
MQYWRIWKPSNGTKCHRLPTSFHLVVLILKWTNLRGISVKKLANGWEEGQNYGILEMPKCGGAVGRNVNKMNGWTYGMRKKSTENKKKTMPLRSLFHFDNFMNINVL